MTWLNVIMDGFSSQMGLADTLPVILAQLVVGILLCCYGRDLLRLWAAVVGFLAGFGLGLALFGQTVPTEFLPAAAAVCGVFLAFLAGRFLNLAGVILCGAVGLCGAHLLFASASGDILALGAAAGIVVGLLLREKAVILLSAVGGAWCAAVAVSALLSYTGLFHSQKLLFYIALSLALTLVQVGVRGQSGFDHPALQGKRLAVKG